LGFAVLLEQPARAALGTARQLWLYTVLWTLVCLALAVAGGFLLGRGVTQPVQDLAAAAARIEGGDYGATVPVGASARKDELAQLGRAFNEMAAAVARSMQVIQTQKDELQTWNEELHRRVEERTREVQEAIQQVIRSQKLGALAELGAGLAHELNNPLTGIMGLAQLGLLDLPARHAQREPLQQIVDQCKRMRDIVQNLQRFSLTPENVEHAPLDIATLCDSVITLAGSAIEEGKVVVERSFPPDLPRVVGNADELQQMLLHLVHNAVRAMPSGGKLVLAGREVEEAVRLTIADTGKGIPATHLERIFEPFFAADKTETHRPGLGLSVAHRIVSEHHGRITVRSKPGEGTEFAVVLPGRRQELHLK
jgi:signal transduction histidine kinase